IDGVTVHGNADVARVSERTPTFLVTLAGQEPLDTARALAERGFFAWHGDFYAPGAIRGVGLDSAGGVRLSFLHYNTTAEVDDLLATLRELA
ncbi:MAG TPA: cysteine desulfurase-like protein, partial [Solirubrobacteraceae bacterium]